MKTIITREIDGVNVVVGFGKLQIDPEETRKKQVALLDQSAEYQAYQQSVADIQHIRPALKNNPRDRQRWQNEMDTARLALAVAQSNLDDFKARNFDQTITFVHPRKNEVPEIATDGTRNFDHNDFKSKLPKKKTKKLLTVDGDLLDDLRGQEFWKKEDDKWSSIKIKKLSDITAELSNMTESSQLSDGDKGEIAEQFESERIIALSNQERTEEKNIALQGAASRAAQSVLAAEIMQEDRDKALRDARALYADAAAEIEIKYEDRR